MKRKLTAKSILLVMTITLVTASPAIAHWDMESRFWQDKKVDELFRFRLHNGTHANRQPVDRELNICFWLEQKVDRTYQIASEKICESVTMKSDEWQDFKYSISDLTHPPPDAKKGEFAKGVYRAKITAKEIKNWLSSLIFGAALERLVINIENESGQWKQVKNTVW